MKKVIDSSDVIGTLIFSAIGFAVEYSLARVPYAGPILAIGVAFFLGYGLGWVVLPRWSEVVVAVCTLGGAFLGIKHQLEYVQDPVMVAIIITIVCAFLFFWGFARRCARGPKESERD